MLAGSLWFPVALATFALVFQRYFSALTWFLTALLCGWVFGEWLGHDARRRGIPLPRVSRALCFFGWPVLVPLYAFYSRSGSERWRWLLRFLLWLLAVAIATTMISRRA